eukprot:3160636-Prymnesium_polylepis.1
MRRGALSRRALHGHRGRAASKVRRAPPHSPRRVRTYRSRPLARSHRRLRRAAQESRTTSAPVDDIPSSAFSRFLLTINEAKRAYTH